jgi:hypothetical protein
MLFTLVFREKLMKVTIENGKPVVKGLPEMQMLLFFGKVSNGYLVVYGPEATYSLSPTDRTIEMFDAFVATGRIGQEGRDLEIHQVHHGHKYPEGGAMVEFGGIHLEKCIIFSRLLSNERSKSTYNGCPIDEVYLVV